MGCTGQIEIVWYSMPTKSLPDSISIFPESDQQLYGKSAMWILSNHWNGMKYVKILTLVYYQVLVMETVTDIYRYDNFLACKVL